MTTLYPLFVLLVGLVVVIGAIVYFRVHAFLALITAAIVVSLLAPGEWSIKLTRVAAAFGETAAGIGIVIALAAVIGKAMTESGAADRIVKFFLDLLGPKRAAPALTASGFTLAIPVFFDTVFYLLVPLARSMYHRMGGQYVKFLVAVACATAAHALVPPTPGPLVIASELGVDLGVMMLVGIVVAAPAAAVGLWFASWSDRRMPHKIPGVPGGTGQPAFNERDLPGLGVSLAPIILPVLLITLNTATNALLGTAQATQGWERIRDTLAIVGNPNFALLVSAVLALYAFWRSRRPSLRHFANSVEEALMSGGVIVLITAAGGAFGGMLKEAEIAPAIRALFGDSATGGYGLIVLAFAISSLMKFAQGSSTAAMIVTAGMFAAMIENTAIGLHPVYLATAIGSGSLVGSWMNDSGFWIFSKMGGLSEVETLKTWTPLLVILGVVGLVMTLILATVMPMAGSSS